MNKLTGQGGPGRGQGRKSIGDAPMEVIMHVRMSAEQRAKLEELGGSDWVRKMIDYAHAAIKK